MKISGKEQQERKSRIVHTAFQLFSQRGIGQVTLAEIAREAKVSEISIYRYFDTKQELVVETGEVLWREAVDEAVRLIDAGCGEKSGFGQLQALLDGMEYLLKERKNYLFFSQDYKLYLIWHAIEIPQARVEELLQPLFSRLRGALEKGAADGTVSMTCDLEDTYWAIWGLICGTMIEVVLYERLYESEAVWSKRFDAARMILERGLRSD